MSATPRIPIPNNLDSPLPMTLPRLAEKKRLGEPIVMVTAYDYPSAQVAEAAGVDVVLVGDSGAMTVLGYPSTVPVSTDEMLMLAAAVRRGLRRRCSSVPPRDRGRSGPAGARHAGRPVVAPGTLARAIVEGQQQSPSVLAAMYGVDIAELTVKISEGALYPNLFGHRVGVARLGAGF